MVSADLSAHRRARAWEPPPLAAHHSPAKPVTETLSSGWCGPAAAFSRSLLALSQSPTLLSQPSQTYLCSVAPCHGHALLLLLPPHRHGARATAPRGQGSQCPVVDRSIQWTSTVGLLVYQWQSVSHVTRLPASPSRTERTPRPATEPCNHHVNRRNLCWAAWL